MDTILLIIGTLIILWLVFELALRKARGEGYRAGYREAQRQVPTNHQSGDTAHGCITALAVIGFLSVCGFFFYIGLAISASAGS
jgi:hypothetical protein